VRKRVHKGKVKIAKGNEKRLSEDVKYDKMGGIT